MQERHNVFQTWTSWQLNCSSSSSLAFLWIYGSNTKDIPWVLFITELAWTLLVIKLILQLVPESFGMIMDIWQLTAVIKKLYPNCLFATFWKKWKLNVFIGPKLTLQSRTGPVQGQNRVFPVGNTTQGKPCFHYGDGFAVQFQQQVLKI